MLLVNKSYIVKLVLVILIALFTQMVEGQSYGAAWNYGAGGLSHNKYHFFITKQNGEQFAFEAKVDYDKKKDTYYLKGKKKRIYPNETINIARVTTKGDTIRGYANTNCWLFPVFSGAIEGYSVYAEETTLYLTHFFKYDNTVNNQVLTYNDKKFKDNILPQWVLEDEEASALVKKDIRRKRFRTYGSPGILVVTIVPAIIFPYTYLVYGIVIGVTTFWVPFAFKRVATMDIIEAYNKETHKQNTMQFIFFDNVEKAAQTE